MDIDSVYRLYFRDVFLFLQGLTHNEALAEELTQEELEKQAEENFYSVFWELDRTSMETYLAEHPDTLANGWEHIYINEAGFDDEGTSIQSTFGEQVLAINYREKILLVHAEGEGYRGVLAVAKVPGRLSLENAAQLGTIGQTVGEAIKLVDPAKATARRVMAFLKEHDLLNEGEGAGEKQFYLSDSTDTFRFVCQKALKHPYEPEIIDIEMY